MSKPLIVGLDIGTTSALAIFDLKRNLLYTKSKRDFSLPDIVSTILKFGKPLIIATDKKKIPPAISKIAASFNCKISNPDHDLAVGEKDRIVNIDIGDSHEKDALAAALFAGKEFSMQFAKIDNTLISMGLGNISDEVKEMIVNKRAKNINEALELLKPKQKEEIKIIETNIDWKEKAETNRKRLLEKERSYDILKMYSEKLEEKLRSSEAQTMAFVQEELKKNEKARKEILKDKEIRARDILIKQLQYEINNIKNTKETFIQINEKEEELKEIKNEKKIPVIIIKDFIQDNILSAHKEFGLNNQVIWFRNTRFSKQAIKTLVNFKPKVVIGEFDDRLKKILHDNGLIVVEGIEPTIRKYYSYVDENELEKLIEQSEKQSFLEWLNNYKTRSV